MTKRTGWLGWLYSHGVVLAYGVIISIALAISAIVMMTVVLFIAWWNKIH